MNVKYLTLVCIFLCVSSLEVFGGIWSFEGNLKDREDQFCIGNDIELELAEIGYLYYAFSEQDPVNNIANVTLDWQIIGFMYNNTTYIWTVPEYNSEVEYVNFKFVSHFRNATQYELGVPINCLVPGVKNPGRSMRIDNASSEEFQLKMGPNPFVDELNIHFNLYKQSEVSIAIYDLNGRLVDVLVENETMGLGVQNIRYKSSHLQSGVYFVNLMTETYQEDFKILKIE